MPKVKFKYKSHLHIMDDNEEFVEDILKMVQAGSLNDVKIRLSDGEIVANKDILMARSVYFKTMFNNSKFIESRNELCRHEPLQQGHHGQDHQLLLQR